MKAEKENRGGKRAGAGRPRKPAVQYSDSIKRDFEREMKAIAKETGKTFARVVLEKAYGMKTTHPTDESSAIKNILDIFVVKESRQEVEVTREVKPQVYLPEPLPKPQEAKDREKAAASVH